MPRLQFSLRTIFCVIAAAAAISALAVHLRPRMQVLVENSGRTPIHSLTLHVTGNSYSLGDVPAGARKAVVVEPTGESSLVVGFEDEEGNWRQSDIDCYFEPGYRGTISVSIKDGAVDSSDDIGLY